MIVPLLAGVWLPATPLLVCRRVWLAVSPCRASCRLAVPRVASPCFSCRLMSVVVFAIMLAGRGAEILEAPRRASAPTLADIPPPICRHDNRGVVSSVSLLAGRLFALWLSVVGIPVRNRNRVVWTLFSLAPCSASCAMAGLLVACQCDGT